MIGSARLRLTWLISLLALACISLVAFQGPGPDGGGWVCLGIRFEPGFDVRAVLLENLGRSVYVAVPALIVFGGFQALLGEGSEPSASERIRARIWRLARACAEGLFMSHAFLLPVAAIAYRAFSSSGTFPAWLDLMRADLNGGLLGVQMLLWAGVLACLLKSNPWLGVLGAYVLLFLGRLTSWVCEWGEYLALPDTFLTSARGLVWILPVEVMPLDPPAWERTGWVLGVSLCLASVFSLWRFAGKKPT